MRAFLPNVGDPVHGISLDVRIEVPIRGRQGGSILMDSATIICDVASRMDVPGL